ncbi:capsule assembly Wzi family protein [Pseudothermotoga sp.]
MTLKIASIMILMVSLSLFGALFQVEANFEYDFETLYDATKFRLSVPFFDSKFIASGGFRKDNIVFPPYSEALKGHYWYWDEGYFEYRGKTLEFDIGVKQNKVGPGQFYNLFVSDNGFSYPTVRVKAKIDSTMGPWTVETLWGGLRPFETNDKPVKAFIYRRLSISPSDNFEIGYQESVLFLNRYFDPYYYFVPIPIPGIQEFWHLSAPWGLNSSELDDNSMVGLYAKISDPLWSIYAELLIDDINLNRFLSPQSYQNPDKIAFLLGFSGKFGPTKLTVEFAGASAFTFQRTHPERPYEYVMFEGEDYPIEKNMIGYKHGENNLACIMVFDYHLSDWTISLGWESVLYGTRTPSLPWHGGTAPTGTKWLIGEIKSQHNLTFQVSRRFDKLFEFLTDVNLNGVVGLKNLKPFVGFGFTLSIGL